MSQPFIAATFAAAAAVALAGCASTAALAPPAVPDNLRPADGQKLSLAVQAAGVQIYECAATKADPVKFEWSLTAPEADLFDRTGGRVGKHYAGPTWEVNGLGKVVGEVSARADAPDAGSIPWLLLKATSVTGSGAVVRTQSVQRVATVGGKAPAGCDRDHAGTVTRVPYRATYYFYSSAS